MDLCNNDVVDYCFEHDIWLRKCAMATTVMTPKLVLLLDIVQLQYQNQNSKAVEVARKYRRKCATYIHNCILNVADLNQTALRLAANLYYSYDDILIASSIEEKIAVWKTAYLIAEKQVLGSPIVKISVSDIPFTEADYCELAKDFIEKELYDYSDELEAWVDIYMKDYEEYNDDDEQQIYDDIISIITDLRFLAGILHLGE